jgi:hypothetical protein
MDSITKIIPKKAFNIIENAVAFFLFKKKLYFEHFGGVKVRRVDEIREIQIYNSTFR